MIGRESSGRVRPRDLRASDAEREAVIGVLTDAYAEGRITLDEHEERMRRAYEARTLGELSTLVLDLPNGSAALPDLDDGPVAAVLTRRRRAGRFVLPDHLMLGAVAGTVTLDLREAVFATRDVVIDAVCAGGLVIVLAPPTVRVDVEPGRLVLVRRVRGRRTSTAPTWTVLLRAHGVGRVTVRTTRY